jgi:hypothetical protein
MCHHRLPWQHRVWRVVPANGLPAAATMAKLTMRVAPLAPLNEKELIDQNVYAVSNYNCCHLHIYDVFTHMHSYEITWCTRGLS